MNTLIPGLDDNITVSLFAIATGIFVFAMFMIGKSLKKAKANKKPNASTTDTG